MVTRGFEWDGVRFRLPAEWDVARVANAVMAHDESNGSFTLTRRPGDLSAVVDAWDAELTEFSPRELGVASGSGPAAGLVREVLLDERRVLTQLFVAAGEQTVVATYAADHNDSYDRRQAHRVITSVQVNQHATA